MAALLMQQDGGQSRSWLQVQNAWTEKGTSWCALELQNESEAWIFYHSHFSRIKRHETHTPWPQSASELYRPSDHRLSANLVPTFTNRGYRVVSATDPYGRIQSFLDRSPYFFLQSSSSVVLTRLSGPRSRSNYFSESVVAPGIEPRPLNL
jgi:hypothetical protein